MKRLVAAIVLTLLALPAHAALFRVEKLAENVHAAIALPEAKGAGNALLVATASYAVIAGAHFTPEATEELLATLRKVTPLPLRYVVVTHHHRGYNYFDFDFPPEVEIVTSWQAGQALRGESRRLKNPLLVFDNGMTLFSGNESIVITSTGSGHSEADLIVNLPGQKLLFASDLVFNRYAGFMADGSAREWVLTLQALEAFPVSRVVPGRGDVTDPEGIRRFRIFLQDFLTEALRHVEKGVPAAKVKESFSLPAHEQMPGYAEFLEQNIGWAYREVTSTKSGK